jgi:hypothetical protein
MEGADSVAEETKQISKSMLIVKSEANALKGVEQFLKNREWDLTSTHKMVDAILHLTRNKPSFVLITVDHASPKVKKLPKLILSSFPCCVMVFAEKSSSISFKLLSDAGIEYRINPPITGPAIERAVNKFIRDQEQAAKMQNQEQNAEGQKNNFDFQVEIKGSNVKTDQFSSFSVQGVSGSGATHGEGAGGSLMQNLLAQLENDETESSKSQGDQGPNFLNGQSTANSNGNVINIQRPLGPEGSNSDYADGKASSSNTIGPIGSQGKKGSLQIGEGGTAGSHGHDGEIGSQGKKGSLQIGEGKNSASNFETGQANSSQNSGSQIDPKTGKPRKDIFIGKSLGKNNGPQTEGPNPEVPGEFSIPTQDGRKKESGLSGKEKAKEPGAIVGQEVDHQNAKVRKSDQSLKVRKEGLFKEDSIFVKGVNDSLDGTVTVGDGTIKQTLEDSSHLACIVVESEKFSGYLVAALGKNKKIDNQFINLVKTRLLKFLEEKGEPIQNENSLHLNVKEVDFEDWAIEYAQFLRKSVHNGDEVAMAFFPFSEARTTFGESADEKMVSINIQEIQTETPLEFNIYVYLAASKRYILYTPHGGKFLKEQKMRLSRQGMTILHVQKDDVQNVGKFKAQNHLNSLINDFEGKKKKAA